MTKLFLPISCALLLGMLGCSESTEKATKKEPEKPPEPVTGQSALFRMYQAARTWGPDSQVLKMISSVISEVPDVPRGKAAVWEATFVSANRNQARSYTFSIIEQLPLLHKGVFAGLEQGWS